MFKNLFKKKQVKANVLPATDSRTMAQKLHEASLIQHEIENVISDAYEKYEPEVYETLDFDIGSDEYDNSIEIYFKISLPYPYEPCKEIRQAVYALGFSIVYWNFLKDSMDVTSETGYNIKDDAKDEIRGWEPRHTRNSSLWIPNKYGYVDGRFDETKWKEKYYVKNKKL